MVKNGGNFMGFKIGDIVRLKEDNYYGTNKEIDHVRIKVINTDGTFSGIGFAKASNLRIYILKNGKRLLRSRLN